MDSSLRRACSELTSNSRPTVEISQSSGIHQPPSAYNRVSLPLAVEAGEAGLAGEELLHGGLFEVALLGDEPVQSAQQRIHIAQRLAMARCSGGGWECAILSLKRG